MDKLIIGQISGPHGIKGEIKVYPLTDYPERFRSMRSVILSKPIRNGDPEVVNPSAVIEGIKGDGANIILKFEGVSTREQAEAMKGLYLQVTKADAVKLPEGTYFVDDILGLTVVTDTGEDLGKVVEVFKTGSNDVYTVKKKGRKDICIPAIKDVVKDIDLGKGIITITPMPGLID